MTTLKKKSCYLVDLILEPGNLVRVLAVRGLEVVEVGPPHLGVHDLRESRVHGVGNHVLVAMSVLGLKLGLDRLQVSERDLPVELLIRDAQEDPFAAVLAAAHKVVLVRARLVRAAHAPALGGAVRGETT